MLLKIEGPLFFGNAEKIHVRANLITHTVKNLVIDLEKMSFIDMSGIVTLNAFLSSMAPNRQVYLCGKQEIIRKILMTLPTHTTSQIEVHPSIEDVLKHITAPMLAETVVLAS